MGTMRVLRERAETNPPVAELLEEVLRETGYVEALEAERTIEAQGRMENLEELVEVAREYDGDGRGAVAPRLPAAGLARRRRRLGRRRRRASSR